MFRTRMVDWSTRGQLQHLADRARLWVWSQTSVVLMNGRLSRLVGVWIYVHNNLVYNMRKYNYISFRQLRRRFQT